jgi:hypothetical protein
VVYHDKNKNGQRDTSEPGIAGVAVSDQVQVVKTDAQGKYEINNSKGFGFVMISQPAGFSTTEGWQKINSENTSLRLCAGQYSKSCFVFFYPCIGYPHQRKECG